MVEELHLVRQQLPEVERPLLSENVQNTQVLRRLHDNALQLQSALETNQQDAVKRVRLARIEDEAQLLLCKIAEEINGAELLLNVDGGPSMGQLSEASKKLDKLPEQMQNVPKVYEDLQDSDDQAKKLKVI